LAGATPVVPLPAEAEAPHPIAGDGGLDAGNSKRSFFFCRLFWDQLVRSPLPALCTKRLLAVCLVSCLRARRLTALL